MPVARKLPAPLAVGVTSIVSLPGVPVALKVLALAAEKMTRDKLLAPPTPVKLNASAPAPSPPPSHPHPVGDVLEVGAA